MTIEQNAPLLLAALLLTGNVLADSRPAPGPSRWPEADVAPVIEPGYREACGSCHTPYSPGLLPAQSWEAILADVGDHFGQRLELTAGQVRSVRNYVLNNAAGRSPYRLSWELMRSLDGRSPPLRITEFPYFVEVHRDVAAGTSSSLSHCESCHPRAEQGEFGERR